MMSVHHGVMVCFKMAAFDVYARQVHFTVNGKIYFVSSPKAIIKRSAAAFVLSYIFVPLRTMTRLIQESQVQTLPTNQNSAS
uniref:Uncharacterized protein n=1 Tax=Pyxicephalus adspersus TaxID=30357 RepID=A0AAV3AE10_PYXAD|nr:TPA: hypothetical protein GDO54_008070 [Pyxicephalus adspersus]